MHIHLISIRASVRYSLLLTFAADCLFSGQSRRSPVMPELIDPLLAPHPPSPWRHSGSLSFSFFRISSSVRSPLGLGSRGFAFRGSLPLC